MVWICLENDRNLASKADFECGRIGILHSIQTERMTDEPNLKKNSINS